MKTVSGSRTEDQHRVSADPVITTVMTSRVVAVGPGMALIDALRVMDSAGVRHLPVVEGGRCVGLLTEIDMLRRLVARGLVRPGSSARLTAGEVCRQPAPVTVLGAAAGLALQRPAGGGAVVLAEPADGGVLPVALGEASGHYAEVDPEEAGIVRAAVRVFLLDDHEVVRRGLRELLEDSGDIEVVGEAARADEALRRIPAVRPDVAVLDARLPDGSGIEVCREIRSSLSSVACLILTSYDDDEALFAAIMAGAAGYVLKQIRGTDLVNAVHRVARGQSLLDPAVTASVFTRLREGPPATDPRLEALSDREQEVLALIADGLSNREIGARLYLAEKTVKNHVSRLLAKLQMQRRTQVAVFGAAMRDQGELRPQRPES